MKEIRVNGEPEIVWKTRDLILETFKDLEFVEEGHKYYLYGNELPSVSAVTHQFAQPFDEIKMSMNYAKKHGQTPEFWRDQWKYKNLLATTAGTEVHLYGECMTYLRMGHPELIPEDMRKFYIKDRGWLIPTRPKEEAVVKYFSEMYRYDFPVLAETKVFNNFNPNVQKMKTDYCGTFDILYYRYFPEKPEESGFIVKDYKGLPLNTKIATKTGWTTMGEIKVGDEVFDKDGKLCKVTGTSKIHRNPCYKITLDGWKDLVADEEHRWLIGDSDVVMTKDLKPGMVIEAAKELDLPDIELLIDPYEYGRKLAKEEVYETMPYFRSSYKQRLDLLRGIIDEAGSYDEAFGIYSFGGDNMFSLINKIEELVFTLGIIPNRLDYMNGSKLYSAIEFRFIDLVTGEKFREVGREITKIEITDTVETRCIEVDSPSHTYCFGKSMIVTHNTNKELIKDYSRQHGKNCLEPFSDLPDEPLSMYTLQLSCYQIPLMDLGIKVIDREIIWLKDDKTYEVIRVPDITQKLREVL